MRRITQVVVVGVILCFCASGAWSSTPRRTVVVNLEPTPEHWVFTAGGQRKDDPKATITIHYFGGVDGYAPSCHVKVTGAMMVNEDLSYALYYTTRPSPREYVHGEQFSGRHFFNMSWSRTYDNWTIPVGIEDGHPPLTFFIALEPDDGRPFEPVSDMDRVIFVGSSTEALELGINETADLESLDDSWIDRVVYPGGEDCLAACEHGCTIGCESICEFLQPTDGSTCSGLCAEVCEDCYDTCDVPKPNYCPPEMENPCHHPYACDSVQCWPFPPYCPSPWKLVFVYPNCCGTCVLESCDPDSIEPDCD